ncbi:LamG-like jellyroll fold domain-containing protein [Streptacidiphilus monticola]|uniref:non-reducing end alpha-L-arabinofuranosidase n=1 Tax=Streptacidiphilus monticola TaxID=2161674 RepID=A0ABW1FV98_9ACTN
MFRSFTKRRGLGILAAGALLVGGVTAVTGAANADTTAPAVAAHYTLDEGSGTTAKDSSGNGHDGTVGSGASWAAGNVGAGSLSLNGTVNGNVDIPTPVVDTTKSFTVSAWAKLNSTSGYQTFVSIDGSQVSGFYLQQRGDTGEFAFTRLGSDSTSGTSAIANAGFAPATGTWYHLVGVYDTANSTVTLYVNGVKQESTAYSGGWQATGHTAIGRGLFGGSKVDFVNGSVDDVQFYQAALTGDQVGALNTSAHWGFDEGSGTTAADSAGAHTATLGSGTGWATPGRIGAHALTLDGTADGNATADSGIVDTAHNFSVAAWVKLNSTSGYQTFVSVDGSNVSGYYLGLRADTGRFAFTRLASDSTSAAATHADASGAPAAGTWYHLVGVDDVTNGKLYLYVNGVQAGSAGYSGGWNAGGRTAIGRGLYGGNPVDFANGAVDEVQLFDHALSADEVQSVVGTSGGTLSIDAGTAAHALPSTFFGVMTEDINHSGEGGLYAELLQNRSLMASATSPTGWSAVGGADIALDGSNGLNTALTRSLLVTVPAGAKAAGVANGGFWGIPVVPGRQYQASFFAKSDSAYDGPVDVSVVGGDGTVYAHGRVDDGVGTSWHQFKVKLTADQDAPATSDARFVLTVRGGKAARSVWLSNVSLFPPTYKNVRNGLRTDLMAKIAGLKPSFIREPGGNYLEGNTLATRFDWKSTIGPVWTRPGHQDDAWGYWSTDGMGLLEYLEWAESVGAEPLLAVYAGYNLNGTHVPVDQLGPYVQDALDEIQYATGSTDTVWGRKRAEDGHPAPFKISYVEIGNEDWFDKSGSYDGDNGRFAQFYDAIRAKYPSIKLVATTEVKSRTPDVLDLHYYESPAWMDAHADLFDSYSRSTGTKIMVGEWAAQEGKPTPDLNAALGDASWLTGLMRNSDLVTQEAYAPLLANVNSVQWNTNLIGFDALTSYGSPSYWVQSVLAKNHGDQVLNADYAGIGGLNTVVTRDSTTGKIYVVVVNPNGTAQPVKVSLTGAGAIPATGTATVVSSARPTDTNSITQPDNIVPVTTPVTGLGSEFTRTFPAYSMTVLTLG